jgi:hypothetical protein
VNVPDDDGTRQFTLVSRRTRTKWTAHLATFTVLAVIPVIIGAPALFVAITAVLAMLVVLAMGGVLGLRLWRTGAWLTDSGTVLVVRTPARTRRVPVGQITQVEVINRGIRIYTTDARRLTLSVWPPIAGSRSRASLVMDAAQGIARAAGVPCLTGVSGRRSGLPGIVPG